MYVMLLSSAHLEMLSVLCIAVLRLLRTRYVALKKEKHERRQTTDDETRNEISVMKKVHTQLALCCCTSARRPVHPPP